MIIGNAKSNFPDDNITITVPYLVIEPTAEFYPKGFMVLTIPFETDSGNFSVDMALKAQS